LTAGDGRERASGNARERAEKRAAENPSCGIPQASARISAIDDRIEEAEGFRVPGSGFRVPGFRVPRSEVPGDPRSQVPTKERGTPEPGTWNWNPEPGT